MSDRLAYAGIGLAVLASGLLSWITGSLAVLGITPAGIAVYLFVGVAGPQYVLARRRGDETGLGIAALATCGALLALIGGVLVGNLHGEVGVGVTAVLAIVVFGVLGGAVVREFRAGYRGKTT